MDVTSFIWTLHPWMYALDVTLSFYNEKKTTKCRISPVIYLPSLSVSGDGVKTGDGHTA